MTRLTIPMKERICFMCGKNYTKINIRKGRPSPNWYNVDNKPCCYICWNGKVFNKRKNLVHNPKRIKFKGKIIFYKEIVRTGQCQRCFRKIGDEFINNRKQIAKVKKTSMHHINYHDDDILKDVIELCNHCHGKESVKQKWEKIRNKEFAANRKANI